MNSIRFILIIYSLFFFGCKENQSEKHVFISRYANTTGISFVNELTENDSQNMLTYTNFYTGAGVGIGDINNDSLPDIYIAGNQKSGRLYINQGGLKFLDITKDAGIETDRWVTGVSLVDINQDRFLDIYLCVSGPIDSIRNKNLLFINQGPTSAQASSSEASGKELDAGMKGVTFKESAGSYGIDDPSQSTHASFFDYDNDGDLDLILIINPTDFFFTHDG